MQKTIKRKIYKLIHKMIQQERDVRSTLASNTLVSKYVYDIKYAAETLVVK